MFESVLVCGWLERTNLYRVLKNWWLLRWWKIRGYHPRVDFDIVLVERCRGYHMLPRNAGLIRQYDNATH